MRLLELFQMIPSLPGGLLVVLLLAVGLVVFGCVAAIRRQIGRALAFAGGGILVLWGMSAVLLSEAPSRPPTAAESARTLRILQGVVGLCIAGGGAAAVAGGAGMLRSTLRLLRIGVRTRGRIVDFNKRTSRSTDGTTSKWYAPVIAFETEAGEEHRFEGQAWGTYQPTLGRVVSVLYDPGAPGGARLYSFLVLWVKPLLVGAMGLAFFAAGVFAVFAKPE